MVKTVLITGHSGLIGKYLWPLLEKKGFRLKGLDLNSQLPEYRGDITSRATLQNALQGCHGVVHLAAVSRVLWGHKHPKKCWQHNAEATKFLHECALQSPLKPWIITASSREVYGQPQSLLVDERHPLNPMNIYAKSKLAAEQSSLDSKEKGLKTAILRFSNVYGCIDDHADRVVPAFCRAAVTNGILRVEGNLHAFDFTYIGDTVRAIAQCVEHLQSEGDALPPLNICTGRATTLGELARLTAKLSGMQPVIKEYPARDYDVSRFVGSNLQARNSLGWEPRIHLAEGVGTLIRKMHHYF